MSGRRTPLLALQFETPTQRRPPRRPICGVDDRPGVEPDEDDAREPRHRGPTGEKEQSAPGRPKAKIRMTSASKKPRKAPRQTIDQPAAVIARSEATKQSGAEGRPTSRWIAFPGQARGRNDGREPNCKKSASHLKSKLRARSSRPAPARAARRDRDLTARSSFARSGWCKSSSSPGSASHAR